MSHPLLQDAKSRIEALRGQSKAIEASRRVPAALAQSLAEAGHFRMLVPEALGGLELRPRLFVEVLEALALGDSATAWCVMTGSTTGLLSAYLPEAGAQELWAAQPDVIMAGIFAPMGRAIPVEGGYKLSGRWPFASGCDNSSWRMAGALVMEGDTPRSLPNGKPELLSLFFPAQDSQILDTWSVMGLCGTGSHDLAVEDIFVPEHRSLCMLRDAPRYDSQLYRFPAFGLLASGVAAVGLGIARAAIDAMCALAQKKKSAARSHTQGQIGRAETSLRACRGLLLQTLDELTAHQGPFDDPQRASLRMATTFVAESCAEVVGLMYHLGGGSSIYQKNPLQRHFRDIHTLTQHIMVSPQLYTTAGRILLGIPTDTSQL